MSVALEDMSEYARSVVSRLGLEAHPEGGWYIRDWQSPHIDGGSAESYFASAYLKSQFSVGANCTVLTPGWDSIVLMPAT